MLIGFKTIKMFTHCNACKIEICAEDVVVTCEGLCDDHRIFHAKCVGLSYDEGCACLHSNIFWMCDGCRDLIEKGRFRNALEQNSTYATQKEVNCLKSDVERISKLITQFSTYPSKHPQEPHHVEPSCPLSSTKINEADHANEHTDEDVEVFVSNITLDVTDNEIEEMVCESTGARNVRSFKCLVPAWKDTLTMNYVSFKVAIDAKFRNAALKRSNWPVGVRCREFRNFAHTP